jgi:hypothetical protein
MRGVVACVVQLERDSLDREDKFVLLRNHFVQLLQKLKHDKEVGRLPRDVACRGLSSGESIRPYSWSAVL